MRGFKKWKLEVKGSQIADTGDYDSHYELSIGGYVLHSNEELDDEDMGKFQKAISDINNIGMPFYDPNEGVEQHIIGHYQDENKMLYKFLESKGLMGEYEQFSISDLYKTPKP